MFNIVEHRRTLNTERADALAERERLAHECQMAFAKQLVDGHLAALTAQSTAFQNVILPLVAAANEQADVVKTWLRMFQTSAPPTTSVVREDDELRNAAARGALAGIPAELQLAYVLQQTADPLS